MTETVAVRAAFESGASERRDPLPPKMFEGLPLLIPVPRAAVLLGISRSTAYRCGASGDLPTAHLGSRVYIVTARLQQLLESA